MIREEFQIFKKYIILNFFLSANYSESAWEETVFLGTIVFSDRTIY